MKFHCYMKALPQRLAGQDGCALAAINGGIKHMLKLVRSHAAMAQSRYGFACRTRVSEVDLRWLAFTAFHRVLHRKQVRDPPQEEAVMRPLVDTTWVKLGS